VNKKKVEYIIIWVLLIIITIFVKYLDMWLTNLAVNNLGFTEANPLLIMTGLDSWVWLNIMSVIGLILIGIYLLIKVSEAFKIYLYALCGLNAIITVIIFLNIFQVFSLFII